MTNDRLEVADLITRLYALLDDGRYDELGSVYAPDVEIEFPNTRVRGLEAAISGARARHGSFRAVQHINSDVLVDIDGDRARIRANHLAVHVLEDGRNEAGLVLRFEAARTPDGWRIVRGRTDVRWRT